MARIVGRAARARGGPTVRHDGAKSMGRLLRPAFDLGEQKGGTGSPQIASANAMRRRRAARPLTPNYRRPSLPPGVAIPEPDRRLPGDRFDGGDENWGTAARRLLGDEPRYADMSGFAYGNWSVPQSKHVWCLRASYCGGAAGIGDVGSTAGRGMLQRNLPVKVEVTGLPSAFTAGLNRAVCRNWAQVC